MRKYIQTQTKSNLPNRISFITLGSLILMASYFIWQNYQTAGVYQIEQQQSILIQNIFIAFSLILFIAILLQRYLRRIIDLLQAKEKAEHTALIKAKFLSTMSHEIRTPMNAVIGLTNILLEEKPRSDQADNLKTLKFSADLLLSLINDILDFSKIEAGKISFESVDFDLHALVRNIRNAMNIKAIEKQLSFDIDIDPKVPAVVVGDQVRLSQILTNLVGNAIKFTPKGQVSIGLKLMHQKENSCTIRFSVKDSGIGISEDKFEKIFLSFSQADTDTTRKFGGTGLGLSITKKLLELQGSSIQVLSEIGKGSNFFFDLSFEIGKEQVKPKPEKTFSSNFESFHGARILLVEDNPINVLVAKKFLNKWNLNIDVAVDGMKALNMVQVTDYELVLMDLEMPVMDGYTATSKIRELKSAKYQRLPIIALSASAIADFRQRAIKVGMNEFVTKPFNPGELHRVISRFLSVPA